MRDEKEPRTDSGSGFFILHPSSFILALSRYCHTHRRAFVSIAAVVVGDHFHENDGSGLYYYRARYYDPALMRFIAEDPIGLAGGYDLYSYVNANPISFADPSGLLFMAHVGPTMGLSLEESAQIGQVGNAAAKLVVTGAPVVAAGTAAYAYGGPAVAAAVAPTATPLQRFIIRRAVAGLIRGASDDPATPRSRA